MKKHWMFLWMLLMTLGQARVSDAQIAQMFMVGFDGKTLSRQSTIVRDVCARGLGGVILFKKNIGTPQQLSALTRQLNHCAYKPLIATDQEGGKVRRVRFGHDYPRASQIGRMGTTKAKGVYGQMAKELHAYGINYNLAPVADLDIEPRNYIIHKLGRSYGSHPDNVKSFNTTFIKAMHRHHVLTSLKHFPGHGSSLGDTHQGFVDVSKQWKRAELEPFKNAQADSVMVAHVVCDPITEPGRPASLSPKAIAKLHRINPRAVVITDDLQMGAIRKSYGSLAQVIRLAINAGDDLLLFGNQLTQKNKVTTRQLIQIVRRLIAERKVSEGKIRAANRRIASMRRKIGLRNTLPLSSKRQHPKLQRKRPTLSQDMF